MKNDKLSALAEPWWVRLLLMTIALGFVIGFLLLPLLVIFYEALHTGWHAYITALEDPYTIASIKLTLTVTGIVVPCNLIFGIAAAWSISRFDFWGKHILITLIDLPFSVSPVIAGLVYILLFGANSVIGQWLIAHDISIIFALPGLVIATIFVTFPFVARELTPLMMSQGAEEEEAAIILGANAWQVFWRITIPNIKWALLYGVLLCSARSIGEFGAVSVVSGHIKGLTNTIPLHVEILYNEYNFVAAFAVSSMLTIFAILTLAVKSYIEWKEKE